MKKIFLIAIVTVLISACATKKHYSAQEERQRLDYAQQIMENDPEYKKIKKIFIEVYDELERTDSMAKRMPAYIYENPKARSCVQNVMDKVIKNSLEASLSGVHLTSLMKEFETQELAQMAAYSSKKKMHLLPDLQSRYKNALHKQLEEDTSTTGMRKMVSFIQMMIEKNQPELQRCVDMVSNKRKPNKSNFQEGLY